MLYTALSGLRSADARAQFCPWCQTPLAIENAQEQAISSLRKDVGVTRQRRPREQR